MVLQRNCDSFIGAVYGTLSSARCEIGVSIIKTGLGKHSVCFPNPVLRCPARYSVAPVKGYPWLQGFLHLQLFVIEVHFLFAIMSVYHVPVCMMNHLRRLT